MSVLEGSLGVLPRRVLVAEDDVDPRAPAAHRRRARRTSCAPMTAERELQTPPTTPCSAAACVLRQPPSGHRVGHDAILLAAATGGDAGEHAVDLGAGVGAAGLALARRVPG